MSKLLRAEVTDQHGTVAEIIDLDALHRLSASKRSQLDDLAGRLVRDMTAALGGSEDHTRKVAIAELIRLTADEAAYERACQRKGVLPL